MSLARQRERKRGFVLPTLLMLTMVLLLLATTLLSSGTTSLRAATLNQQSDQALYAAEAGLVRASQVLSKGGSLGQPFSGELQSADSTYEVTAYENPAKVTRQVPDGPLIPPETVYLLSQGKSENGTVRQAGALFHIGLQAFTVGALGNHVTVSNSSFDAYDSGKGDYSDATLQNDLPLLASNTTTGETFNLDNADVKGDIFVGPGGDPNAQIVKNNSTFGNATAMASAIDLEKIEVPADDDADGGGGITSVTPISTFEMINHDADGIYHFADGKGLNFSIDPSKYAGKNSTAHIIAPGLQVNLGTDGVDPYFEVRDPSQPGHYVSVNMTSNVVEFCGDSGKIYSEKNVSLSDIFFKTGDAAQTPVVADVVNPSVLEPGHYDSVTVDSDFQASFSKDGVYVIKSLNVSGGGRLALPPSGVSATVYVTESMTVDGEDALVNETLKAPNLKIYYTGQSPVMLSGGSRSYYTLVSPGADVTLSAVNSGSRTKFFGALVGDKVTINNASFHFDTATSGIGTGTLGTAVSLIQRHRL